MEIGDLVKYYRDGERYGHLRKIEVTDQGLGRYQVQQLGGKGKLFWITENDIMPMESK